MINLKNYNKAIEVNYQEEFGHVTPDSIVMALVSASGGGEIGRNSADWAVKAINYRVNSEVLAVLEEVKSKQQVYKISEDSLQALHNAVPLSAIEQLERKYRNE